MQSRPQHATPDARFDIPARRPGATGSAHFLFFEVCGVFVEIPGLPTAHWLPYGVGCKADCNGLVRGIYLIHAALDVSRDS
jgi:hypothetical protein